MTSALRKWSGPGVLGDPDGERRADACRLGGHRGELLAADELGRRR